MTRRTGLLASLAALGALGGVACGQPPEGQLRNTELEFTPLPRIPAPTHPNALVIADVDGDGDRDVVVPGVVDPSVMVVENLGGGAFAAGPWQPLAAGVIEAVALSDGRDGEPVRVAFTMGAADVVELHEVDPATLRLHRVATLPLRGAFALAAGDLDGDGDVDLAASGMTEQIVVPFYAGAAGFERGRAVAVAKPQALGIADLRDDASGGDDGRAEIAVVQGAVSQASLLAYDDDAAGHVVVATTPTAAWPTSILATDLDGDATLDLVGAANLADRLFIGGLTDGALTFTDLAAGHGAVDAAAGDLDGDGTPDLVVTNKFEDTITIFTNAAGILTAARTFPTGGGPTPIELADLDGDDVLDIALTDGFSNELELFLAIPE